MNDQKIEILKEAISELEDAKVQVSRGLIIGDVANITLHIYELKLKLLEMQRVQKINELRTPGKSTITDIGRVGSEDLISGAFHIIDGYEKFGVTNEYDKKTDNGNN